MRHAALLVGLIVVACAAPATPAPGASSTEAVSPSPVPTTTASVPPPSASPALSPAVSTAELQAAVDAADVLNHLAELQAIADAHGGHRADGSTGFAASLDYVGDVLTRAGYVVRRQPFGYRVDTVERQSRNLVAETVGAGPAPVIMLGAHLDSVIAGPGINDNGSGIATLLVLAERLAAFAPPPATIRFAFWGAEEAGQHGAQAYLATLGDTERGRIVAYLNFDMLGSPNHLRFVYDDAGAPEGSRRVTNLFASHFESAGLAWEPIDLAGKTDHWPFAEAGIATGGLFSGGIEPKTAAQAARFGGLAGAPADPCSHRACDTIGNVSPAALDEMADAIAHVLIELMNR